MTAVNFLTQSAQLSTKSGRDDFGDQSYGSATSVACKFVDKQSLMVDDQGEETTSDSHMYVSRTLTINNEDRITYNSKNYEVIRVMEQVGTVTSLGHKRVDLKLNTV